MSQIVEVEEKHGNLVPVKSVEKKQKGKKKQGRSVCHEVRR